MAEIFSFNRMMALTMVVGAAREEAAAQGKFEQLRQEMLPLIAQFRKDGHPKPLMLGIRRVLGDGWIPQDEWAEYLEKLMEKNDG